LPSGGASAACLSTITSCDGSDLSGVGLPGLMTMPQKEDITIECWGDLRDEAAVNWVYEARSLCNEGTRARRTGSQALSTSQASFFAPRYERNTLFTR
jgi:hypothetical protein